MICANRCAESRGVQLLVRPSPIVFRVIHITGVDSSLNLGETYCELPLDVAPMDLLTIEVHNALADSGWRVPEKC